MKNLIRIVFIPAVLALPAFVLAASLPGMTAESAVLPLSATTATDQRDCWVDHVQVQPGGTSGASGSDSAVVVGAADIGKLERAGHPGAEHRKFEPRRSTACREGQERRPAE